MQQKNHELFMEDLKGKQSVRATFRLPRQIIDLLSVMAAQLGIKQKSLFDQLIDDPMARKKVVAAAKNLPAGKENRLQKTFVISRSSLVALDKLARDQDIPRDVLVEVSIRRLIPIMETELKRHEKRKILLRDLSKYLRQGRQLQKKTENFLGRNDQLYAMIEYQVKICEKNAEMLKNMVDKGKPMEEW
jgi:hypothetical protein